MSPPDLDDPVQARAHALRLLEDHARELFAKTRWNSLTLCVAQYWDDEANDAVHNLLVASVHPGPAWPHTCPERERQDGTAHDEVCEYCDEDLSWLPGWHDNGWAIRAFEPYCKEGATQNDDHEDAYLPYAVARRSQAGPQVAVVGTPVRPWLLDLPPVPVDRALEPLLFEVYLDPASDIPRQVLADWLLEQGEARGRFIAAQLAGHAADELLLGHQLEWAGPLGAVCVSTRTVFRRGFPAEVRVCLRDEQAIAAAKHEAWRTIEALEWHEDSLFALPELPLCTRMDGVAVHWLPDLAPVLPQLTHLSVRAEDLDARPLAMLHRATSLRSLRIDRSDAWRADVPWSRLQRLEVTSRDIEDWLSLAQEHGIDELIVHGAARVTWSGDELVIGAPSYSWGTQQARLDQIRRFRAWFAARSIQVRARHDGLYRGGELVRAFETG